MGDIQRNAVAVCHRGTIQANDVQSSAEAGLNSAIKGMSESIGVIKVVWTLFMEGRSTILSVGANVCKGMLLRGVAVHSVPRIGNASDILAHPVGELELKEAPGGWGATLLRHSWT